MNRFKFLAMVEEFPFLDEVLGEQSDYQNCDGIVVKRATKELVGTIPQYQGATGSLVGIDDGERFSFVLKDNSVIQNAVQDSGNVTHNEAHTDNEYWGGETILEAIDRHHVSTMLTHIVLVEYGYNVRDHYSLPNYRITIFKPAKDFSWADLIEEAKEKFKVEVLAEANF